jgi:hypothetical protein
MSTAFGPATSDEHRATSTWLATHRSSSGARPVLWTGVVGKNARIGRSAGRSTVFFRRAERQGCVGRVALEVGFLWR